MRLGTNRLAGLLALMVALAPSRAGACWDGYMLTTDELTIQGPDEAWSVERARDAAAWLPRIRALLVAHGARAEVAYDEVVLLRDGGGPLELRHRTSKLERLYRVLARAVGATRTEQRAHLALTSMGYTVQLAATRSSGDAERLARRWNAAELGEHGFYEAGGFPATNPTVHVIEGTDTHGAPLYRVIVGTFLDAADAERARAEVSAATGRDAFVRAL